MSNPNQPSPGEFENWKASPITRWYMGEIELKIEGIKQLLGEGEMLSRENITKTQTKYAEAVGIIEGCRECLNISTDYGEDEEITDGTEV